MKNDADRKRQCTKDHSLHSRGTLAATLAATLCVPSVFEYTHSLPLLLPSTHPTWLSFVTQGVGTE